MHFSQKQNSILNFSIKKARRDKRIVVLVELRTTNEFFFLEPVLEILYKNNDLIMFEDLKVGDSVEAIFKGGRVVTVRVVQ